MERKLKITLASIVFAVVLQYASVFAAIICPLPPLTLPGMAPVCGTGLTLNNTNNLCCMTVPDTPGGTGNYCSIPAKLSTTGMAQCPTTHPYDMAADLCCGPTPITQQEKQQAAATFQAQQAAMAAAAAAMAGANNAAGANANCVDKAFPGRASDCPANAALCNNTLYYQLMTEQCPLTCGRCTVAGTNAALGTASALGNVCVDGTNAQGISECPQNSFRCNQPIWSAFMLKECPFTCNPACKTGVTTVPVITTVSTTTTTTTTTPSPGK